MGPALCHNQLSHHSIWELIALPCLDCSTAKPAPHYRTWESNQRQPQCLAPAPPHRRPSWNLKLLALGWSSSPTTNCCSHSGSGKQVKVPGSCSCPLSFCLSLSLSNSTFQINKSVVNILYAFNILNYLGKCLSWMFNVHYAFKNSPFWGDGRMSDSRGKISLLWQGKAMHKHHKDRIKLTLLST